MLEKTPWKVFKERRGLDLKALIKKKGFTKYEEVVSYFDQFHVAAPSEEEFVLAQATPSAVEEQASKASVQSPAKKAPAPRRKRAAAKKTTAAKTEDAEKVWQDGVEGSYEADSASQTKKAPPKKRATTRKRTTTRKKKA